MSGMIVQFATCERWRALQFLKRLYPSVTIEDSEESAKEILDFIESDVVRITDPDMHRGAMVSDKNWDDSLRDKVIAATNKALGTNHD